MNGPAAAVIGMITARGRSGDSGDVAFAGLFPAQGRSDWPHGVQEPDAPRFALEHAAALRPGTDDRVAAFGVEGEPQGEIVDLFNRRLR
ncbi:MAG TPA: hypothetical protein VKR24_07085 [Candidatus Limnocylindrales bacterium]|nr:hypothetical protein [Candidatus Limnocylindrales bacterium]